MKAELKTTKEYDLFAHNEYQQPVSEAHISDLVASMNKHGFLPSKPITVINEGEWLRVVDGHHRLAAAKAGGFSVYYVEESKGKADCIGDINYNVRKWSTLSFVKMYAAKGNQDYAEMLDYVSRGIALQQASSLLHGQAAGSCNAGDSVRAGTFKIKSRRTIEAVLGLIEECRDASPAVASKVFVDAFSMLFFVPEFDPSMLRKKIAANPRMVVKCATRLQMLEVIEEVYNFRNQAKVNLKHLAVTKAEERKVTFNRNKAP